MTPLNASVWVAGLLLQAVLLTLLLRRPAAARLPLFTGLIASYLVRSVLLAAVYGHIHPPTYTLTVDVLSLVDLLFQIAVACELFHNLRPARTLPFAARFAALLFAAAALAWAIAATVPADPRTSIDRGVLLVSALMPLVWIATPFRRFDHAATAAHILRGFVLLGLTGIASQIGRSHAALHHRASTYRAWSYAEAFAYLAVLMFWCLRGVSTVRPQNAAPSPSVTLAGLTPP